MEEIKRNIEMHGCKKYIQTFLHMNVFVISIHFDIRYIRAQRYSQLTLFANVLQQF